ncbi:hypothetical protein METHP14_1470005 [Pseudomonas sp. P14-2025]
MTINTNAVDETIYGWMIESQSPEEVGQLGRATQINRVRIRTPCLPVDTLTHTDVPNMISSAHNDCVLLSGKFPGTRLSDTGIATSNNNYLTHALKSLLLMIKPCTSQK